MSTTETKVRHTWAAQHTAGHNTHGQTAVYDETTGKDIAIVYDGDAHAEFIVRAVNSHADMLEALEHALALINEHADELAGFEHPDRINAVVDSSRAAIAKAKGGAA
jgi:hypothetical protein